MVFRLPFEIGVPDVLYERDLREWDLRGELSSERWQKA